MTIANVQIATTNTDLFAPVANQAVVLIVLCNTNSTTSQYVDLYAVPSGGSAGNATTIIKELEIQPSDSFILNLEKLLLSNGDKVIGKITSGTTLNVTATISSIAI